jgi:magnesium chelatase subunit D
VDGLRADIVIARTAAAHAAWRGGLTVGREDIRVASRLALPHRRRRNPFDAPGLDERQLDEALGEPDDEPEPEPDPPSGGGGQGPEHGNTGHESTGHQSTGDASAGDGGRTDAPPDGGAGEPAGQAAGGRESVAPSGATFRARRLEVPGKGQGAAGRRSRAATDVGRSVGARPPLPCGAHARRAPDRDPRRQRAAPAPPRAFRSRPAA